MEVHVLQREGAELGGMVRRNAMEVRGWQRGLFTNYFWNLVVTTL